MTDAARVQALTEAMGREPEGEGMPPAKHWMKLHGVHIDARPTGQLTPALLKASVEIVLRKTGPAPRWWYTGAGFEWTIRAIAA